MDVSEELTLMMDAVSASEMSVIIYQTTQCNIPEDSHLYMHCHENLKSYQGRQNYFTPLIIVATGKTAEEISKDCFIWYLFQRL
jgi:hypothetical protein